MIDTIAYVVGWTLIHSLWQGAAIAGVTGLLLADAALRDTTLYLKLNNCGALLGGESFSIDHETWSWRLYEIATVEYIDDTHAVVTFNPPLREAVTSGTLVEFDRPRCVMKLVNSVAMDFNTTTYPFSLATAKFIETKFA